MTDLVAMERHGYSLSFQYTSGYWSQPSSSAAITQQEQLGCVALMPSRCMLATLFFLSYAKLLRVTIAVFQPTQLLLLSNRLKIVWNYDGNLNYLSGQHLALFVLTLLLLIVFFLSYTPWFSGMQ